MFQFAFYDASWCLPDRNLLTARLFGLGAIFMAFVALSHFFSTHSVGAHGSKTLPLVAIYETTPMIGPAMSYRPQSTMRNPVPKKTLSLF